MKVCRVKMHVDYYELPLYNRKREAVAWTKIDPQFLDKAKELKLYAKKQRNVYYCYVQLGGGKKTGLHNIVTGIKGVDHINGDTLDNRSSNLRPATHSQQNMNKGLQSNNKTGVRGVSFRSKIVAGKTYEYFEANITVGKKRTYLGGFKTISEAQKARDEAEIKYFKEYRRATI